MQTPIIISFKHLTTWIFITDNVTINNWQNVNQNDNQRSPRTCMLLASIAVADVGFGSDRK